MGKMPALTPRPGLAARIAMTESVFRRSLSMRASLRSDRSVAVVYISRMGKWLLPLLY
ncbi:MAG: hypothetical protein HC769_29875 [Cyanobacteria bacterium CRU_2_1]|nr:hypothetical protein [Cyanobacteria bacterium CRU_2_1]